MGECERLQDNASWSHSRANSAPEELAEDDWKMSVSHARQWGRRWRRNSARDKIDVTQSGRRVLIKIALDFFYDMGTEAKANGEREFGADRNIFKEIKKKTNQKTSETVMYSCKFPSVCLPPLLPSPPGPPRPPQRQQDHQPLLFCLLNVKMGGKTLMMIHFHLMNSKSAVRTSVLINLSVCVCLCVNIYPITI